MYFCSGNTPFHNPGFFLVGNMRRDTVEHVKAFYKLDEHSTNDLMTCGVGEGLLIVGSEVIPTKFTATDHEFAVIKGKHHGTIANEKVAEESLLLLVHPDLKDYIGLPVVMEKFRALSKRIRMAAKQRSRPGKQIERHPSEN